METDDPFAPVAALCHISSSQEEHLRRCRFAGEPEDEPFFSGESSDIPVASTEIMIVSPPESPEENQDDDNIHRDNDVFITPPEESTLAASQEEQQQTVAVDNRDDPADEGVVNNEEIGPWMTSKNTLDTETENLGEIVDSSGSEGFSPSKCLKSLRNHQIEEFEGGDREFHGDNSAKRKLDFNTEALESNFEENIAALEISEGRIEGGNEEIEDDEANRPCIISERFSDAKFPEKQNDSKAKNIDDIDKFRYVGPMGAKRSLNAKFSEKQNDDKAKNIDDIDKFRYADTVGANSLEKQRDVRARHALPKSSCRNNANVGGEPAHDVVLCSRNFKEVTILDVLNILPEDYNYDPSLANVSVLEAAKRRGINFP
ncbi:hypothetical protein GH714_043572 [Hevea brasiliensis]|uniref:Uncharacterized protein n=1 Tax=Hevea brasiliensis TaxID=3981 RepID=A0A6A6K3T4_HEVBR|nr:hypothetical protein GH714_043572 [Hevea brasiliensis]